MGGAIRRETFCVGLKLQKEKLCAECYKLLYNMNIYYNNFEDDIENNEWAKIKKSKLTNNSFRKAKLNFVRCSKFRQLLKTQVKSQDQKVVLHAMHHIHTYTRCVKNITLLDFSIKTSVSVEILALNFCFFLLFFFFSPPSSFYFWGFFTLKLYLFIYFFHSCLYFLLFS